MGITIGYQAHALPIAEDLSGNTLRSPLYAQMSNAEQARVAENIKNILDELYNTGEYPTNDDFCSNSSI